MKKVIYLVVFAAIIFSCCNKDDSAPFPTACFSGDVMETVDSTHNFVFTQCVSEDVESEWDFGDGSYSTDHDPSHVYNHYGRFNVKLKVTNPKNETNIVTRSVVIGHYSLKEIVFTQPTNYILYPKYLELSPFSVYDLVNSAGQLPRSHGFPDGTEYDVIDSAYYIYAEQHNASILWQGFTVYPSDIHNKKYNAVLDLVGNTARLTLNYQIVPH